MVDPVNTKTMYEGNSIHEAGFNMLRENQSRILQLQTHISYFSTMMVKRETEKMNTLLNIDDFFSDNIPWQEHYLGRMNTIGRLIASYPKTSKLAIVHKRLTEDLDDAFAKYNQAINKRGSENMMRNDERNHLAILAEDQLEKVAKLVREMFRSIPHAREQIMEEHISGF